MKENKMIKKNELIVIVVLLFVCLGMLSYKYIFNKSKSEIVLVKVDGDVKASYDLSKDGTYTFEDNGSVNIIKIENHTVDMIEANCPDKLCVKHRKIKYNLESIVCLPHHLVIEIQSEKKSDVDIGR